MSSFCSASSSLCFLKFSHFFINFNARNDTRHSHFTPCEDAEMSGFCVDDDKQREEGDFYLVCFVCHLDLKTLDTTALKEAHLNSCLNALESTVVSDAVSSTVESGEDAAAYGQDDDLIDFQSLLSESDTSQSGLRSKDFSCIICDLDLSKRRVTARCYHLKR